MPRHVEIKFWRLTIEAKGNIYRQSLAAELPTPVNFPHFSGNRAKTHRRMSLKLTDTSFPVMSKRPAIFGTKRRSAVFAEISLIKNEVYSITHFVDVFQSMPQFIRVTWPRPRPFVDFYFFPFWEIIYVHSCAKFQICSFTCFGNISEGNGGMPNFTRVLWPRPHPFRENLSFCCSGLPILSSVPNIKCLLLFSLFHLLNAFFSTCLGQKSYCACVVSRDLR